MADVVGIASTGAQDTINASIGAIGAQIDGVHSAVHVVTSAIFPPTNDTASATAVGQELANVNQFSAMLKAGLAQIEAANAVVSVSNHTHQAVDVASSAAVTTVTA